MHKRAILEQIETIIQLYAAAFARFEQNRAAPPIAVEFYNYVGLRHTIRLRNKRIFVRISDIMRPAPTSAHEALALILVAKLLRRKVPKAANEIYANYAKQPEIVAASSAARQTRSHKIIGSARGAVYDLNVLFERVNQKFFQNLLEKPVLTWSPNKTFRIFGHHDNLHKTVMISRTLDDARVPEFVVEFVLYHELLHIKHPTRIVNGRRQIHTAIFRRDEQLFPRFEQAEEWLIRLAKKTKSEKAKK